MAPTWFITGTSAGFGLALSKHVLVQGHNLVSLSRHPQPHPDLVFLLDSSRLQDEDGVRDPPKLYHIQHDLSNPDPEILKSVISSFLSSNPTLTIDKLVNNAAVAAFSPLETLSTPSLTHLMTVNFYSPLWLIQALLPTMRSANAASVSGTAWPKVIINISSTQGLCCDPAELAYEASKHALEALSGVLAEEVAVFGLRTLVVNLGSFRTAFATSGDRAGLVETVMTGEEGDGQRSRSSKDASGIDQDPYMDPEHPVRRRIDMVTKFANIPNAARGDPAKGAAILFDGVMLTEGSAAEKALDKQRKAGTGPLERLLIGSDGWVKIEKQARRLEVQVQSCEQVSRMADADVDGGVSESS